MVFYEIPVLLIDEISVLSTSIDRYIHSEHDSSSSEALEMETKFKALRVAHGIYEQRERGTYMLRIRCPGGFISPEQLKVVADMSLFGTPEVHFTTRQEVQIHGLLLKDMKEILSVLFYVGLSSRGGGGNTVRNILCPADSGISKNSVFDVSPFAICLTSKLIKEDESWNLPRKFKIAFSDNFDDIAYSRATCLGFIAVKVNEEYGFKVYIGGGLGRHPRISDPLFDFIPTNKLYPATKAVLNVYNQYGNRRSKHSSRIKFLLNKMGIKEFSTLVTEEFNKLKEDESNELLPEPELFANEASQTDIEIQPIPEKNQDKFDAWIKRCVSEQKQLGLYTIKIMLRSGDLLATDTLKLCNFLTNFGENNIRCDRDQNIRLRNIPFKYLSNLFTILNSFKNTLVNESTFLGEMINCTGAQTCQLGICKPRGLVEDIHNRLLNNSNLNLDDLTNLKLNISGCPNSCGMHHVADIGFFGKVGKKDGDIYPSYNVLLGADMGKENPEYAKLISSLPAHNIAEFLDIVLTDWLSFTKLEGKKKSFKDYIQTKGISLVKELCEEYNKNVPSKKDSIDFYRDFRSKLPISLADIGQGECSAGIFDMIKVDKSLIDKEIKKLSNDNSLAPYERAKGLKQILLYSSRMLLITKGVYVDDPNQIFKSFKKHFVSGGFVSDRYNSLLETDIYSIKSEIKEDAINKIIKNEDLIKELSKDVIDIYVQMDDSLTLTKASN